MERTSVDAPAGPRPFASENSSASGDDWGRRASYQKEVPETIAPAAARPCRSEEEHRSPALQGHPPGSDGRDLGPGDDLLLHGPKSHPLEPADAADYDLGDQARGVRLAVLRLARRAEVDHVAAMGAGRRHHLHAEHFRELHLPLGIFATHDAARRS